MTLPDIHRAVGGPRRFAIANDRPNPDCAVEKVVNAVIEDAMGKAEALPIARGFDAHCAGSGGCGGP